MSAIFRLARRKNHSFYGHSAGLQTRPRKEDTAATFLSATLLLCEVLGFTSLCYSAFAKKQPCSSDRNGAGNIYLVLSYNATGHTPFKSRRI